MAGNLVRNGLLSGAGTGTKSSWWPDGATGFRLLGVTTGIRIPSGVKLRGGLVLLVAVGCAETGVELPETIEFNRDVRPILSNSCLPCHGPDENAREAHLRLDVREIAIAEREGIRAIVPENDQAAASRKLDG